jgi:hypothetical protein
LQQPEGGAQRKLPAERISISLAAYLRGIGQVEAAMRVAAMLGIKATASHVRFRSPANRPCRSYSSGFCVEVGLYDLSNLRWRQAIRPLRLTPAHIRADPSGRALDQRS